MSQFVTTPFITHYQNHSIQSVPCRDIFLIMNFWSTFFEFPFFSIVCGKWRVFKKRKLLLSYTLRRMIYKMQVNLLILERKKWFYLKNKAFFMPCCSVWFASCLPSSLKFLRWLHLFPLFKLISNVVSPLLVSDSRSSPNILTNITHWLFFAWICSHVLTNSYDIIPFNLPCSMNVAHYLDQSFLLACLLERIKGGTINFTQIFWWGQDSMATISLVQTNQEQCYALKILTPQ